MTIKIPCRADAAQVFGILKARLPAVAAEHGLTLDLDAATHGGSLHRIGFTAEFYCCHRLGPTLLTVDFTFSSLIPTSIRERIVRGVQEALYEAVG